MENIGYNTYGFIEGVPFKSGYPCGCGDMDMDKLKDIIEDAMACNNADIRHLGCQINCAKNNIIQEIHTHAVKPCMVEKLATKDVNAFTQNKFDEVDFNAKFSDLNDQVKELIGKF